MVFERLFGDSGTTDPAERRLRLRRSRSILDSLLDSLADLEQELGSGDRSRLDEYLTAVRDVERASRTPKSRARWICRWWSNPAASRELRGLLRADVRPAGAGLPVRSDTGRDVHAGPRVQRADYPQIGVTEAHHPLSHHQNDRAKMALLAKLNAYHASLFASYLEKLRGTADGDGSLLDNTLLLYGAGMADGNTHDSHNLPMLLIGSARPLPLQGWASPALRARAGGVAPGHRAGQARRAGRADRQQPRPTRPRRSVSPLSGV